MGRVAVLALAVLAVGFTMAVSDGIAQQAPAVPSAGAAVPQVTRQVDLNKATDAQLKAPPGLKQRRLGEEDQGGAAVQAGRRPEEGRAGARLRTGQESRHGDALTRIP